MKQITLILFFALLFGKSSRGQGDQVKEMNRVRSSYTEFITRTMSADVSSFMKVNHIPVSNYTGRAKINIPIYTIKDGKITVPISISYNTGGVKVNDMASAVGLNWTLNAGGVITKIIRGKEDCFYDYNDGKMESLGWLLKKNAQNKLGIPAPSGIFEADVETKNDYEPDLFVGSAPGISLEFVHDLDQNPFELNETGNKISTTFGSTETISFFDIPTEWNINDNTKYVYPGGGNRKLDHVISSVSASNIEGLQYNFEDIEISQSAITESSFYSDPNYLSAIYETAKGRFTNEKVDNYRLSTISDPLNNKTVVFEYENYQLNADDITRNFIQETKNKSTITYYMDNRIKYPLKKRLKKILFSNGVVYFLYNKNREDILGEKALTDVLVKNLDGETIKHIKLNHDYFISGNGSESKKKRLKLSSVYEIDSQGKSLPGHIFHYNNLELPEYGSSVPDFLGYYNAKGFDNPNSTIPKIYYQVNKGDLSFLPFKLFADCYEIPGRMDVTFSEANAQAGILTKIEYPTGATQELVYESNSFLILGKEVKAGGLRIKKIRIKDSKLNTTSTKEYVYLKSDGKTSGTIGSVPRFVDARLLLHYEKIQHISQAEDYVVFYVFTSPKTLVELTQDAYVGYSRVTVQDSISNGYEEYLYSSFDEFPNEKAVLTDRLSSFNPRYNFKKEHGLMPTIIRDKDYCRGRLKCLRVFDKNNTLIKEDIWNYTPKTFNSLDLSYDFSEELYRPIADNEILLLGKIFTNTIALTSKRYLNTHHTSELRVKNRAVAKEVNTEFDPAYPLLKKITKTCSNQNEESKQFYYPHEIDLISSYSSNQKSIIKQYTSKEYCDFSTPLKTEKRVNNNVIKVTQTEFDFTESKIRLSKKHRGRNDSQLKLDYEFVKYDVNGNPLELVNSNGIHTCFIWGYNNQYLLAKLEGITYNNIPAEVISELKTISNTNDLRNLNLMNKFKEIRLLPVFENTMITTYTHTPLVGINSKTTPNGMVTYYEYDNFGRLKNIKDTEFNIIEHYQYNYSR
jgi:hypothetical protein